MERFSRITIVGAGAMGCLFAARLAEAGVTITLIDSDGSRLGAIERDGITIDDDSGQRSVRVRVSQAPDAEPTDLVILFTKGMHSRAAIQSVAHLAGENTLAVTLQNGLGNAEAIAEVFAADRIVVGATDLPADLAPPATVSSHGRGQIWLGAYAGAPGAIVDGVVALFNRAGLPAEHDPTVLVAIWEKVAFNAALNTLAAVTGLRVAGMDRPEGREIAFAVLDEVVATAGPYGITLDPGRMRAKVEHVLVHQREHKASMLQDIEAGRPTEIETINGAVVRAAAAKGVSTPVTQTLANLVRLIDQPSA